MKFSRWLVSGFMLAGVLHAQSEKVMIQELQRDVAQKFHGPDVELPAIDLPVQRHESADVVAVRMQILGECAGHVGQASGLRQRRDLRGDEADA